MVVDIHNPIIHIDKEDLVDLVAELQGIRTTVLLIEVVLVRRVDLEYLDKEILVDMAELPVIGVQVVNATKAVAVVVPVDLVVMHHFQIIMHPIIHHLVTQSQLGVDGTPLAEIAVVENQTPLLQHQILQVMFLNLYFH